MVSSVTLNEFHTRSQAMPRLCHGLCQFICCLGFSFMYLSLSLYLSLPTCFWSCHVSSTVLSQHSDQMIARSQVSWIALCMSKVKSPWVSGWQGRSPIWAVLGSKKQQQQMTATTAKTITRATITTKKFIFVKFWCLDRTLKDNHVRGFWKTRTGTCKDKTDYFGKWCIFQTSTILSNQRDLESNFSFQNIHQSFLGKDCKLTRNETYQKLYIIQCTRSTQMYKCTKAVQEGINSESEQQTKIQKKAVIYHQHHPLLECMQEGHWIFLLQGSGFDEVLGESAVFESSILN